MMKIIVVLVALTQVYATQKKCEGILIDGVMYMKEVLKEHLESPYQFSIDYNSNTLFFSYTLNKNGVAFQSAYLNLQTEEFNVISTITNGFASAVDARNNRIFISARGGVYEYDLKTKQTKLVTATDQSIWQMFYKDGLYYSIYPTEEVYLYRDGRSKKLDVLIGTRAAQVSIGGNGDTYFSNSSGLFVYKNSNKDIVQLGEQVINGMNADYNGIVYFSSPDGVFVIDEKEETVRRVVTLDNVHAAAIEKDGSILIGTDDSIIRLKRTDKCHL